MRPDEKALVLSESLLGLVSYLLRTGTETCGPWVCAHPGLTTETGGWAVSQTLANLHAGRVGFIGCKRKEEISCLFKRKHKITTDCSGSVSFQPLCPRGR